MGKYNRILVTGINGLVGQAIAWLPYYHQSQDLQKVKQNIFGIGHNDYDLLQWSHVDRMMRKIRPDAIIHLAAKVGGVQANMGSPATFFMENVTMNTHILEAARIHGVKRVICCLSTCVFPDPCPLPLEPKSLHMGPPHPSNYGYAFAKRMLAVQCQAYNQEYGTNFLPVIPCNIYGQHDNFHPVNSHVVPALIKKFWEAKLSGNVPVTIWGSGTPLREFIYSNDVARLLLELLDHYDSNEPIILSTGKEHSISDLAEAIAKAMDFKGKIVYDKSKPDGQFRKPSNNAPLRELFPNFVYHTLEEGIYNTVDWFRTNYPKVRGL